MIRGAATMPGCGDRMSFHLGKPILVMLFLAGVCAAGIWMRPAGAGKADLTVWVSADAHRKTYVGDGTPGAGPSLVEQFERDHHKSVDVQLVSTRSEDVRLTSKFMSDSTDVPDAVEVEINSVGKYFR